MSTDLTKLEQELRLSDWGISTQPNNTPKADVKGLIVSKVSTVSLTRFFEHSDGDPYTQEAWKAPRLRLYNE